MHVPIPAFPGLPHMKHRPCDHTSIGGSTRLVSLRARSLPRLTCAVIMRGVCAPNSPSFHDGPLSACALRLHALGSAPLRCPCTPKNCPLRLLNACAFSSLARFAPLLCATCACSWLALLGRYAAASCAQHAPSTPAHEHVDVIVSRHPLF